MPRRTIDDAVDHRAPAVPGEILLCDASVVINAGSEPITLRVVNTADRPLQVGSHFHFAETDPPLDSPSPRSRPSLPRLRPGI